MCQLHGASFKAMCHSPVFAVNGNIIWRLIAIRSGLRYWLQNWWFWLCVLCSCLYPAHIVRLLGTDGHVQVTHPFLFHKYSKEERLMLQPWCERREGVHRAVLLFGGVVVSMLASGTQDRGFKAVACFGRKNPQHAFLRRGSNAVCSMSQICAACKRTLRFTWKPESQAKLTGHFSPNSVLHKQRFLMSLDV
jgi:hypothetical protein